MTIAVHVLDRNLPKFSVDQIKVIIRASLRKLAERQSLIGVAEVIL